MIFLFIKIKWHADTKINPFNKCSIIVEAFDRADQKKLFVEFYQDKADYVVSGNGMAGLTSKKPLEIRRFKNVFIVGDNLTDTAEGHPPMAPRVAQCAAMMAETVLDLTLGIIS